jgi:hypothetical protein
MFAAGLDQSVKEKKRRHTLHTGAKNNGTK